MRRVWTAVALAFTVVAVSGCTLHRDTSPAIMVSLQPTPTPPTVDPATTRVVCDKALSAAKDMVSVFDDRLAEIDRAAARGDQTAVIAAATEIHEKILNVAGQLRRWSGLAVAPEVRRMLEAAAQTLTVITSARYTGGVTQQRQVLERLVRRFTATCDAAVR